MSNFCPHCQQSIQLNENFCSKCNFILAEDSERKYFLSDNNIFKPQSIRLNSGETLSDRFKIKEPIGIGAFGAVYLAKDIFRDDDIALKIVTVNDHGFSQLKQELCIQGKISDFRYVIRVNDIHPVEYESTKLLIMSMEFADGGNLRKWLLDHQKDTASRRKIGLEYFKQACLGVQVIHEAGLVHLDLKPENLLIRNKKIKVGDFGLAIGNFTTYKTNQNFMNFGGGTLGYMPPEQIMAARLKDIDPRADIYALGCILFEILDGDLPYTGKPKEIVEKHKSGIIPNFETIGEDFKEVILKCLSGERGKRYKSPKDIFAEIEKRSNNKSEKTQWYVKNTETFNKVKEKLKSIGDIIDVNENAPQKDLTIDISVKFRDKMFPLKFIFPVNFPIKMPKIFFLNGPLKEQLAEKKLLSVENGEVNLALNTNWYDTTEDLFEIVITRLLEWIEGAYENISDVPQWYERNPLLLEKEIGKINKFNTNGFRSEVCPKSKNMIFNVRANINGKWFWIGMEFPKNYPVNTSFIYTIYKIGKMKRMQRNILQNGSNYNDELRSLMETSAYKWQLSPRNWTRG